MNKYNHNILNKYIYCAIYAVLYCSVLYRYVWHSQFCPLIPDIIILSICIFKNGLTNRVAKKHNSDIILGNWFSKIYISFFIIGIISSIINSVNLVSVIWGVRMIIRYMLLFLLIYKNFTYQDLKRFYKIINISFYINVIFVLIQLMTGVTGDEMGGIWSGNGELSIYIILMTLFFSAEYFNKRLSLKKYSLQISFFYIAAIWAEVKMLYFFLPICIYACYVLFKKFTIMHIITLIVCWFLAIPVLTQILSLYYDEEYIAKTLNVDDLKSYNEDDYGFTDESLNRGTIFEKSSLFLDSPLYIAIGHGLGSGNLSSYFSTEVYDKYKNTFYSFFTMSYLLIEVGYIGLFLFLIVHIVLFYRFYILYKRNSDEIIKYWSILGILSTASAFLMIYYNSIPLANYYFGYIFWAICSIAIRDRKKQLILKQQYNKLIN